MALKPCRECKKKVSTEASACPSCGAPRPTLTSTPKEKKIIPDRLKNASIGIESFKKGFYGDDYVPPKKKQSAELDDGFILGFWRGHEGLAKTFWLYFCLGNGVFNVFIMLAASEPGAQIFAYIVGFIWFVFSTLGVFNAANIYKEEKIKSNQTYGYATAAKVAVVILVLSTIGNNI